MTKDLPQGETFDLIFMNSLMHHLSDAGAVHLLEPRTGAPGSPVARSDVLDLVLSDDGLPRKLRGWRTAESAIPRPVGEMEVAGRRDPRSS